MRTYNDLDKMNSLRERLLDVARNKWNSKPVVLSEEQIKIILEQECRCYLCDDSLLEEEDFPEIVDGNALCMDCYDDEYSEICPCCEDYFYPIRDDVHYFFVPKEYEYETGLKCGIYKVLKMPYYRANGFDFDIIERNVELVSETDIDEILSKELLPWQNHKPIGMNKICNGCAEKYMKLTK